MLLWLKLGLLVVLVGGAFYAKHVYDSRIREAAVAACEAKHQEAKAKLVLDYVAMDAKADANAKDRDQAIAERDAARRKLAVAHSDVVLPGDLAAHLLLDSPLESNGGGDAAATGAKGAAVPALPKTFDASEIAKWNDDARLAYDSAAADSLDCRQRYDGARSAQLKGATP